MTKDSPEAREDGPAEAPATQSQEALADDAVVLVVDDEKRNREMLGELLRKEGYLVVQAADGKAALEAAERLPPDVILLDAMMPELDGFEASRRFKARPETRLVPIIMITALTDLSDKIHSIEAGADHFISKPFSRPEVLARVRSAVKLKRLTDELESAENIIFALARAIEAKDSHTDEHAMRVSEFVAELGRRLDFPESQLDALEKASVLHDVGKIAIPDAILNKPGPLDDDEWEVMKTHTVKGVEICRPLRSLRETLPIIRWHHERLDGSGYPDGLEGEQIPMAARVMAVVDVYDALQSRRPYKDPFPPEKCVQILRDGVEEKWWDADVVDAMVAILEEKEVVEATDAASDSGAS